MSDPDESELVAVMDNVLDAFEPLDQVSPPPPDTRPDPVGEVARAMVAAAITDQPDLAEAVTALGAVVILVAPRGWTDAIPQAWRRVVLGQPEPDDTDAYMARRRREESAEAWPLGLGLDSASSTDWIRGDAARALRTGRGILACVDSPGMVSPILLASADATVTLQPPTPEILRLVAEQLGEGEGVLVENSVSEAVQPDHLLGCLRLDQSASAYLARLSRVVARTLPAAPPVARWTLDTLPLPPDVEVWGRQLVGDLANYRSGSLPWSDVDRGALVFGPPGCGKTTFAAALAVSCGVPLVSASYAMWESGPDGKSDHSKTIPRMRQSFAEAKRKAPCILFLDEIDSFIARGRAGHNESWWRPMMNALLSELDGVAGREGVVVIGATNLPDEIDPALRRSGRLDRELRMSLPNAEMLSEILAAHLPGLSVSDLDKAAQDARGASGADCERWAREARRAARVARRPVELADLLAAISPPSGPVPEGVRRHTAYHEAGHALIAAVTSPGALAMVSIRAGSGGSSSLGGTEISSPGHGQGLPSDVDGVLMRMLGGRAAETLIFGQCGAGSGGPKHSDLAQATLIAASAELCWGLGPRLSWICDPEPETLGHILAVHRDIASRVEQRLVDAQAQATTLLSAHLPGLHALAAALLETETLTGEVAERIVREASS